MTETKDRTKPQASNTLLLLGGQSWRTLYSNQIRLLRLIIEGRRPRESEPRTHHGVCWPLSLSVSGGSSGPLESVGIASALQIF